MENNKPELKKISLKKLRRLVFKEDQKLLGYILRGKEERVLLRIRGKGFSEEVMVQLKNGSLSIQAYGEEDSRDLALFKSAIAIFEARKNEPTMDYEEYIRSEHPELWKDIQDKPLIEEWD